MNGPILKLGENGLPTGTGRPKKNYRNEDGVLLKKCSHCGNFYRLHRFYTLRFVRGGKRYETYQAWCKFCMSKNASQRHSIRQSRKEEMP